MRKKYGRIADIEPLVGPSNRFFSMTEIEKLGIFPGYHYNTPIGIYAYPLNEYHYFLLKSDELPFARERPFIQVFDSNMQGVVDVNSKDYTETTLNNDLEKLKRTYRGKIYRTDRREIATEDIDIDTYIKIALRDASHDVLFAQLWNATRMLSALAPYSGDSGEGYSVGEPSGRRWGHILRNLGYNGVLDKEACIGLIHKNEPCQAVFFSSKGLTHIGTFLNKRERPQEEIDYIEAVVRNQQKDVKEPLRLFRQPSPPLAREVLLYVQNSALRASALQAFYGDPRTLKKICAKSVYDEERVMIENTIVTVVVEELKKLLKNDQEGKYHTFYNKGISNTLASRLSTAKINMRKILACLSNQAAKKMLSAKI